MRDASVSRVTSFSIKFLHFLIFTSQVAAGGTHSVVLTRDGQVWTWGQPWPPGDMYVALRLDSVNFFSSTPWMAAYFLGCTISNMFHTLIVTCIVVIENSWDCYLS